MNRTVISLLVGFVLYPAFGQNVLILPFSPGELTDSVRTDIESRIQMPFVKSVSRFDILRTSNQDPFIVVNLDGAAHKFIRSGALANASGESRYWYGEDEAGSFLSLTFYRNKWFGKAYIGGRFFSIETLRAAIPLASEIEIERLPSLDVDAEIRRLSKAQDEISTEEPFLLPDEPGDGTTIRLLVVYTPAVRDFFGSSTTTEGHIVSAVNDLNQAFYNSYITGNIVLVDTPSEVSYVEPPIEVFGVVDDKENLQDPNDGLLDDVHDTRTATGADVVFIVSYRPPPQGFATTWASFSSAFAAVNQQGLVSDLTFAHEFGHILGGVHENDFRTWPRSDNKGHIITEDFGGAVSLMVSGTSSRSSCLDCPRYLYYSDPDVWTIVGVKDEAGQWGMYPTGVLDVAHVADVANSGRVETVANLLTGEGEGGGGGPVPKQTNSPVPSTSSGGVSLAVYPRPTSDGVTIETRVFRQQRVSVRVLDLLGRVVRTLADGESNGTVSTVWDGRGEDGNRVAPGTYAIIAQADKSRKVILLPLY